MILILIVIIQPSVHGNCKLFVTKSNTNGDINLTVLTAVVKVGIFRGEQFRHKAF